MRIVRSGVLVTVAVLGVSVAVCMALLFSTQQSLAALETSTVATTAQLANDKGMLVRERDIRRQIAILDHRSAIHAKRTMLDQARFQRGITIRGFELDGTGRAFSVRMTGTYADIVAATVAIPVRAAGVTIEDLKIEADAQLPSGQAQATLTGTFGP